MNSRQEVISRLKKPLNEKYIETMYDGGQHHVQGWYVKAKANQVFGYDGWDMRTTRLEYVPNAKEVDFVATVEITAYFRDEEGRQKAVTRSGTAGESEDSNNPHSDASKTAETTAMKRAFSLDQKTYLLFA